MTTRCRAVGVNRIGMIQFIWKRKIVETQQ